MFFFVPDPMMGRETVLLSEIFIMRLRLASQIRPH
jgi:hypothetical protein